VAKKDFSEWTQSLIFDFLPFQTHLQMVAPKCIAVLSPGRFQFLVLLPQSLMTEKQVVPKAKMIFFGLEPLISIASDS